MLGRVTAAVLLWVLAGFGTAQAGEAPIAEGPELRVDLAAAASSPTGPPRLARAFSSGRTLNERRAFAQGVLGSLTGYAAAVVFAVPTAGLGILAAPVLVVGSAAMGVHPHTEGRMGWEVFGASVGLASAVPVVVLGVRLANTAHEAVQVTGVLLAATALVVGPGLGAFIAGVTDTDNLRAKRGVLVSVVPVDERRPGVGVVGRF